MLEIEALSGGYGSGTVLHDVNLTVSAGEIVCLLGPNGAGKTSLIRAIMQTLPRVEGRISIGGRVVTGMPPHKVARLDVGVVPEGKGLFSRMTVMDNLRSGALHVKRHLLEERYERVFELFPRLADRRAQIAGTMSGGEQMMLAIGRSLMSEPTLLLLDEPSFGLAPVLIDQVFESLQEIARGERTVLLVEQQVERSLELASRGYVLQKGQIVAEGTSDEIHQDEAFINAYL